MAKKKKFVRAELVLHGVISYPDLHDPKPYKGTITYRTDVLFDADDPQLGVLKKKIHKVRVDNWGDDKTEWPDDVKKRFIKDGNEREDQPTYKDKFFITAHSRNPVSVIDPKGKTFSAAMVKGGMFAKVAVCISPWDNDGSEGMSIYLQAVMIDTSKEKLPGFGGGKTAKQLFGLEDNNDDEESDDEEGDSDQDDESESRSNSRRKKQSKSKSQTDDDDSDETDDESGDADGDEDDLPRSKKKSQRKFLDEDED